LDKSSYFQCASLASQLPAKLFLGKTGDFSIWDGKQSDITPACRVEPDSAEDVSLILKTVINEGCHFAVKSGGHARDAGFSNADAGVTIDLVRMGSVELSKDKKSVKVGAGARWLDVYSTLEKDNLTVVGGRVSDVGVGGLTLGGL
jgi:FAD/FMN-containing dehydrogenase